MHSTTENRHRMIREAHAQVVWELAAAGKQGEYGNYEMAEVVAERIGRLYESEYIYNVIFRPHIFTDREQKIRQLQLFNTN